MFTGMCLGVENLETAGKFYDAVLSALGMERLVSEEKELGYGPVDGDANFWVLLPFDGRPATFGNGTQAIFKAPDQSSVDAFHEAALKLGGTDEGAPGPRDYAPGYYGAYCRDPLGNKLHTFCLI